MAHEACEWNDQDILAGSKREYNDAETHYRFAIVLPDGEPLTSEYMDPSAVKSSVLIAWCEAVRATIAGRAAALDEERAAKRARRKAGLADPQPVASVESAPAAPAPTACPSEPAPTPTTEAHPTTPLAYAKRNLDVATTQLEKAREDGAKILELIKKLEGERSQWAVILDNLEME